MGTSGSANARAEEGEAGRPAGLSLAFAALCAVLLASGCGGGRERLSKAGYEQKVRAVYAEVQGAFEATRGASGSVLAARIEGAQKQLREAADELDAIEPPRLVEEQNQEVVEGMREYARDLDGLREAAEREDTAAVAEFNRGIAGNEAIERMAEAAEEMKLKGYDLGRIAEE